MGTTKLFQMVKSTDANVCKTLYKKKKKAHTPQNQSGLSERTAANQKPKISVND